MAQRMDDQRLVVIWITLWIQEFYEGFFIIVLISYIRCIGLWGRSVLPECYSSFKGVLLVANFYTLVEISDFSIYSIP